MIIMIFEKELNDTLRERSQITNLITFHIDFFFGEKE